MSGRDPDRSAGLVRPPPPAGMSAADRPGAAPAGWMARVGRILAFGLVFVGCPLVFVLIGLERVGETILQSRIRADRRIGEALLADAEHRGHEFLLGPRVCQHRFDHLLDAGDDLASLALALTGLRGDFPGVFEFIVCDRAGRIVATMSDVVEPRWWLERFFADHAEREAGRRQGLIERLPWYRRIFGSVLHLQDRGLCGGLGGPLRLGNERGFLWLSRQGAGARVLVILSVTPGSDALLSQAWIDLAITEFGGAWRGVRVDLRAPLASAVMRLGIAEDAVPRLLAAIDRDAGRPVFDGERMWIGRQIEPSVWLIVSVAERELGRILTGLERLAAAAVALALCIWALAWRRLWHGLPVPASLRLRLAAIVAYVVGMPLLLLGLAAQGFLANRALLLEEAVLAEGDQVLQNCDRSFRGETGRFEAVLAQRLGPPLATSTGAVPELERRLSDLFARIPGLFCLVADERGQVVIDRALRDSPLAAVMSPVFRGRARQWLAELNGDPLGAPTALDDQLVTSVAESAGVDVESNFVELETTPGRFCLHTIGDAATLAMVRSVRDRTGSHRFAVLVAFTVEHHQDSIEPLLGPRIVRLGRRWRDRELFITPLRFDTGVHRRSRQGVLHLCRQSLLVDPKPVTIEFLEDGEPKLLFARRGRELPGTLFFLVVSRMPLQEQLRQLAAQVGQAALIAILLAVGSGWWLAQRLLPPIRQLEQGLLAVQRRDFAFRLAVEDPQADDLARLCDAFNQMLADTADLELGRIVQETLFPSAPLRAAGWEVAGRCVPAIQVGGDCYDHIELPDGSWLLVIGDVSGHGVSSALVAAMAKGLIAHPQACLEPVPLLATLQAVLCRLLHGRKMMTCLLARFEPATGRLVLANAAHDHPFWVRDGAATATRIPVSGLPLGIDWRGRAVYRSTEVALAPGDWLVLASDGLVEAMTPAGEALGDERVAAALPGCRRATAVATEAAIREWHGGQVRPGPPADDITLVVLQSLAPVPPPGAGAPAR